MNDEIEILKNDLFELYQNRPQGIFYTPRMKRFERTIIEAEERLRDAEDLLAIKSANKPRTRVFVARGVLGGQIEI